MFIGHFGLAFAAKRATPKTSLATLLAATSFVDLLWPAFLALGWESVRIAPGFTVVTPFEFVSYPISHSLLMGGVWGIVFGGVYWLTQRSKRGAIVLGLLVLSHWVLDAIVHVPDLPLYPGGSARIGLGLWNSLTGTLILEFLVFLIGVWIYMTNTRPLDRIGRYAIWGLIVLLIVSYLGDRMSPAPSSLNTIVVGAYIGTAVMLILAWWADRHRTIHLAP